jgi:ABC-type glycerol-3-phosphate transport system substrate-binding protein
MKYRRSVMIILCMALLSSVWFISPSQIQADSGKKTLTWFVWATLDIPKQLSEVVFSSFPELRDTVEIKGQLFSSDVVLMQKLRLMKASGEPMPDICMMQSFMLPELVRSNTLEDVSKVMRPYKSKMTVGAYKLVSYRNKQYAFPYQLKPLVWVYREDMFAKAGIDPEKIKTTNDFIAAGKKLQKIYPQSYIWHLSSSSPKVTFLTMILSGNGARFTDKNGNYIVDKDSGVRKAFQDIKKIYDSGVCMDVVDDSTDYQQAFANGTIASDLTGAWIKNNIPKYAPAQAGKWAEALWPKIGGAVGGSDAGGSMWGVPKNAPHKKEAIEFLSKLVLTNEGALGSFKARKIYPSLLSAADDPLVKSPDKFFGASLPVAEAKAVKNFKVFNYSPKYSSEIQIINQYFSKYIQGKMTLDKALKAANMDLQIQIGNPYK